MLVLARKVGESIVIGEGKDAVRVTLCKLSHTQVRIGVEAPHHIRVMREELIEGPEAEDAHSDRT